MSLATKLLSASGGDKLFVEDVFSAYTYTGNNSIRTITNGIDLTGKGGMVWIKARTFSDSHSIFDTARGNNYPLASDSSAPPAVFTDLLTGYTSSGFTLGAEASSIARANGSGYKFASWTFRKAPKFFDVVTYTGTGVNRTISHSLGSVPGMIIVKRTNTTADWQVYHRSMANTEYMVLNTTTAKATGSTRWNSTTPTSSVFSLGTDATVNASGGTYVAYLFAHDTSADGIVQCGSFTDSNAGVNINIGWETQWLLIRSSSTADSWSMFDTMREMSNTNDFELQANSNVAESAIGSGLIVPTATGFKTTAAVTGNGQTMMYLAIRRPNKPPTLGTQVFGSVAYTGNSSNQSLTVSGLGAPDVFWAKWRTGSPGNSSHNIWNRLRGKGSRMYSNLQNGEEGADIPSFDMNGVSLNATYANTSGATYIGWFLKRAIGVFDEICYTGTGANTTVSHSLNTAPKLWFVKCRSTSQDWRVGSTLLAATEVLVLNSTAAKVSDATSWNSTYPSSTVLSLGTQANVNTNAATYIAYLFDTLAGISKVGSYTGNGTSQVINCGFTTGARFVLIKRTDNTGDWYTWDSTRGLIAGNDPYLSLNTTTAEVTTDDSIDPDTSGFIVNQVAATNINVTSATYIYLSFA